LNELNDDAEKEVDESNMEIMEKPTTSDPTASLIYI
jgi:hypothetical protein